MTILVLLACLFVSSPAWGRPLKQRLGWLEQRSREHAWVCRHGDHRWQRVRWHCAAKVWTARELREARAEWEQSWWLWLPDKFARVGACETGYGKRPGNWHWDSGTYVSAYGIIRPAYDSFARALGLATWNGRNSPWDQYRVADAIRARFSWRAWGCGGA